jgi:peptidoglycan hydrolase-like protein with peptidoglycan-binding domain
MGARTWTAGVLVVLCVLAIAASAPSHAEARGSNANTAALQAALRALRHYTGGIDGITGPRTRRAIRRFQRSHHLHADGVAGARTRRALGRRGAPLLGRRMIRRGNHGWDVAALQFMLRRRGYDPGGVDGGFGRGTQSAVKRFQAARGLHVDGRVGRQTLRSLQHARITRGTIGGGGGGGGSPTGPVRFLRPVRGPMGDGFGFVSGRNHTGIDFPEPLGTPIGAAGRGVVTFAGWNSGGYGYLMVIRHRLGYETWYAHQSRFAVGVGASVAGGVRIGYVGSTGRSTGPHLHFEVRHNGAPINPLPYLLSATSLKPFAKPSHSGLECAARPYIRGVRGDSANPRNAVLEPCGGDD